MKKRLLAVLLCLCLTLLILPTRAFAENIVVGWQQDDDGNWYYLNYNGTRKTGWYEEGSWYYFDENGIMVTGFRTDLTGWSGCWFYFNERGAMQTGWQTDIPGWEGCWFYFDDDGVMQTGWHEDIPGYEGRALFFDDYGVLRNSRDPDAPDEQFRLELGGTYYFDLSGEDIPGTVNGGTPNGAAALPDTSLHWVPFTYTGTVDAYRIQSEGVMTDEFAEAFRFPHSLFVADYNVTYDVSWDALAQKYRIFGNLYESRGVFYMLRAPSAGSGDEGWEIDESKHGVPEGNEWDTILDKAKQGYRDNTSGYIKNWSELYSWGQETNVDTSRPYRTIRGKVSSRFYNHGDYSHHSDYIGYRPVLEIQSSKYLYDGTALTFGSLRTVHIDLNGGSIGGNIEGTVKIVAISGKAFTAPGTGGLIRPNRDSWGTYFRWLGSDGNLYAPGSEVPGNVTGLTALWVAIPQFDLVPGTTYWFDLSGVEIPGTVNSGVSRGVVSIPDTSMHWVPFTYTGTINAYVLKKVADGVAEASVSASETTDSNGRYGYTYDHSLFISDHVLTHTVEWNSLNAENLIFGRNYVSGGIDYTLRAPSVGRMNEAIRAPSGQLVLWTTPQNNEWDEILNLAAQADDDNTVGYIKNWSKIYSCGQDTSSNVGTTNSYRFYRGYSSEGGTRSIMAESHENDVGGYRPVLEIMNPGSLGTDGLKTVRISLNGGSLGGSTEDISIVVKRGSAFAAPASEGLTRPDGNEENYFRWMGSDGNLYTPGENVPGTVTSLTAAWGALNYTVTLETGGGTISEGKDVSGYIYGVGAVLPTAEDISYPGHTFKGWYTTEDYSGSPVTEISGTDSGNKTFYAKWELSRYTVTYMPDDNTVETVSLTDTKIYGEALILKGAVFTRPGYTQTGWKTSGEGSTEYSLGDTYLADEHAVLYPVWEIKSGYTVIFDTDGGTEIGTRTGVRWSDTVLEGVADPEKMGCVFLGWRSGEYTVTADMAYCDIAENDTVMTVTLTAQWLDTENPVGEISIGSGTNRWDSFQEDIGFDFFFREAQRVSVTASDNSGKDVRIEYFLSSRKLTGAELDDLSFTEYSGPFDLSSDGEYIIYVRLTDIQNNSSYICSGGIVIDRTAPVISGIENGKTYCSEQIVTVTEKHIKTVTVNRVLVTPDENNRFTIFAADGPQTVTVTDNAGNTTEITVTVNNGHTPETDDGDCTTPVYCVYHRDIEVIAAKAHDFTGAWVSDESGHWHKCANEGCLVTDTRVSHIDADDGNCLTAVVCECGYTVKEAKASHDFAGEWEKDDSGHWHTCRSQGCTAVEPKSGHYGVDDGDCSTAVICECGYTIKGALPSHDFSGGWQKDGTGHWHVCRNADCTVSDGKTAHSDIDDGNCTTAVICECGYTVRPAKPFHDFSGELYGDSIGHWHRCRNRGCYATDRKTAHRGFDDGNCMTAVFCECGYIVTGARPFHDFSGGWQKDVSGHWHGCMNPGCLASDMKVPHSGIDDGDCTTAVLCECGYVLTAARTGHSYGELLPNGNGTHTRRCGMIGCVYGVQTALCTGGTATCTEKAECGICHGRYGDIAPENHDGTADWIRTEDTHEKVWSCCNKTVVPEEKHRWKNGICEDCGYGCDHTGGTADCHTKAVCVLCGNSYGDFDPSCHTGGTELRNVIPETCTGNGYTGDTYCSGCGEKLSSGTEVPAAGHKGGFATCGEKARCDVCGESYGNVDPGNHLSLSHIPEKSSTKTEEGNIEYWYCADCGKYFRDENGSAEISKEDTLTEKTGDDGDTDPAQEVADPVLWIVFFVCGGIVIFIAIFLVKRKNRRE